MAHESIKFDEFKFDSQFTIAYHSAIHIFIHTKEQGGAFQ